MFMSGVSMKKYQDGEIILRPGDHPRTLFKVLAGGITMYTHYGQPSQHLVGSYSPPFCFGETSVLADHPCPYTIIAKGRVVLMLIPEESFAEFIRDHNAEAISIMTAMAQKLRKSYDILDEFKELHNSQGMNLIALKSLAEECAQTDLDASDLALPRTHSTTIVHTTRTITPAAPAAAPQPPAAPVSAPQPPVVSAAAVLQKPAPVIQRPPSPEEKSGIYPPEHQFYPGINYPEFAQYIYSKEYTCPHCMSRFDGVRISYNKLTPTTPPEGHNPYDLRIFYEDFKSEWYEVITCPYCYFSTYYEYFQVTDLLRKRYYQEELQIAYDALSLDFLTERDLNFVFTQHYLALTCSRGLKNFRQINARMWENLIWLYEEAGDSQMARYALEKTLDSYMEVYQNCTLDPVQDQRTCMAIAGMLYQLEDYKKAREWALRVRTNRMGKKAYSNLAEKLIDDVRDKMDELERKARAQRELEQETQNEI